MAQESSGKYRVVECKRGREWIFRVETGDDLYYALENFAKDYNIQFAKIHAAFMGGFEPANFMVWSPDPKDPENWHNETEYELQNLSMLLSMSGIIHLRVGKDGKHEPFPAVHFVIGGGWNVPTVGGHIRPGTIAKGNCEFFITEILGIEVLIPEDERDHEAPENWYEEIK